MNNMINFKSIFCDELNEFIKFKRLCGYEYSKRTIEKWQSLDNFFYLENLTEKSITIDTIDKWIEKNSNDLEITKNLKYNIMKNFSDFLLTKGYEKIYIMKENPFSSKCHYIPYIYSKKEINKIFKLLKNNITANDGLLIYTCISLLYCCGLRVSELVNLQIKDFDYERKTLTIENSKNNVTRLIPLNKSLNELIEEYINQNTYLSNNNYIFKNKLNRRYLMKLIRNNFKEIVNKIETFNGYNKSIRLHDLRHTFAVHTLDNMLENGYKLYQCLPILSIYLGHKSIRETEYYLRLSEINFQNLEYKILDYTKNIYKRKDNIYYGE